MSEPLPNDPALESLAARLAAGPPRLSAERSHELLYLCAYAAGRSAAERRTRRWQGVAAVMTVLLVGLCIPLARQQFSTVAHQPPTVPVTRPSVALDQLVMPQAFAHAAAAAGSMPLDAWQQPVEASDIFEQGLTRFEQADPTLRSLAVANLSRTILEQPQ
jgi:hypothetical protein